jgi:hypothetical protein
MQESTFWKRIFLPRRSKAVPLARTATDSQASPTEAIGGDSIKAVLNGTALDGMDSGQRFEPS